MTTNATTAVAEVKKDISAKVLAKIAAFESAGELKLPKDYSAENALKSAYLILMETENKDGQKALTYCTQESIANALLKMVVWGLSPMKKQCYFIMYGTTLECTPDYTGNIALAKRFADLKEIKANAIHKGDEFEFEIDTVTGRRKILKHKQTLESIGSKDILGAYAVYELNDGTLDVEIMNISQIQAAWNQGATKGNSPAHRNFPDRMARKTVINRACDALIRSSDDKALYDGEDERNPIDIAHEDVSAEVSKNANRKTIDFQDAEIDESPNDEAAAAAEVHNAEPVGDESDNEQPAPANKPPF